MESIFEPKPAHPIDDTPRDAGKSFLLSLLYPGLGHWLIGKTTPAVWISAVFTIGVALFIDTAVSGAGSGVAVFGGLGLRAAIFLYGFALVDSFLAAGEINRGEDPWVDKKPRTAALLNLLTNGFGYFYLGSRFKGIAFMVIGNVLARTVNASGNAALSTVLIVEGVQAVIGTHGGSLRACDARIWKGPQTTFIQSVQPPSYRLRFQPPLPASLAWSTLG